MKQLIRFMSATALLLFSGFGLSAQCPTGHVLYVDAAATGANDGSSPANAYVYLSDAIEKANACTVVDSILIQPGTYYPTGAQSSTNRDSSFVIRRGGIRLIANLVANGPPVVLSGNIGNGTINTDNSYHVLVVAGIPANADSIYLKTLTITDGNANKGSSTVINGVTIPGNAAGGLVISQCANGYKTYLNLVAVNNCTSSAEGGGVLIENAAPYFFLCFMSGNSSLLGGCIKNGSGASPFFFRLTAVVLHALKGGIAYNAPGSSPVYDTCRLATGNGFGTNVDSCGVIFYNLGSHVTVYRTSFQHLFMDNWPSTYYGYYNGHLYDKIGGLAMFSENCILDIDRCVFANNNTRAYAASLFNIRCDTIRISNSIFHHNAAFMLGGAMLNDSCNIWLKNVAFFRNGWTDPRYFISGTLQGAPAGPGPHMYNISCHINMDNCYLGPSSYDFFATPSNGYWTTGSVHNFGYNKLVANNCILDEHYDPGILSSGPQYGLGGGIKVEKRPGYSDGEYEFNNCTLYDVVMGFGFRDPLPLNTTVSPIEKYRNCIFGSDGATDSSYHHPDVGDYNPNRVIKNGVSNFAIDTSDNGFRSPLWKMLPSIPLTPVTLSNSIYWPSGNTAAAGGQIVPLLPFIPTDSSVVVGAGNNAYDTTSLDLLGNARIQQGTIDVGAIETSANPFYDLQVRHMYVDSSNNNAVHDGLSWATAFKRIDQGLDKMNNGLHADTIFVAKGTYYPTGTQSGTKRDTALYITHSIVMLGGYPSGGGNNPDPAANPTIIDGNIGNSSISTDNSYNLLAINNIHWFDFPLVIDGFKFRNANANGSAVKNYNDLPTAQWKGGGLVTTFIFNIADMIRNCEFSNNHAAKAGGAVLDSIASITFENCLFKNNQTDATDAVGGGAIYSSSSTINTKNCNFTGNNTAGNGGSLYSLNNGVQLNPYYPPNSIYNDKQSSFIANTADGAGGAIHVNGSIINIDSSSFSKNSSNIYGGAMSIESSGISITNTSFSQDTASVHGGAIYDFNASGTFKKNSFSQNVALQRGGVFYFKSNPNILVDSSQFISNKATIAGGAIWDSTTNIDLAHNLFIGNTANFGGALRADATGKQRIRDNMFRLNITVNGGGGALSLNNNDTNHIYNNVFTENKVLNPTAGNDGGAMNIGTPPLCYIINNDFVSNQSLHNGGAINIFAGGRDTLRNNIFWQNTATFSGADIFGPYNSNFDNFGVNPQFLNAGSPAGADNIYFTADDGFQLTPCSHDINQGAFPFPYNDSDMLGNTRTYNGTTDRGAYEYQGIADGSSLAINNDSVHLRITLGVFSFIANPCRIIARVKPGGTYPVIDSVSAKVWVETAQPASFVKRHYQLWPIIYNPQNAGGTLTLFFTQQEFDDFNAVNPVKLPTGPGDAGGIANLLVEQRAGLSSNGTGLPGTYSGSIININPADTAIVWNVAKARWEVSFPFSGQSGFFIKSFNALPLQSIRLNGQWQRNNVLLQWATINELNLSHFEAEHKPDAGSFAQFGSVNSDGAGNHTYQLPDQQPANGNNYYRVKAVDIDGRFVYSNIVLLRREAGTGATVLLYPNPASDIINISTTGLKSNAAYSIFSSSGIKMQAGIVQPGVQPISVTDLPAGIYILNLKSDECDMKLKLVKQ